MKLDDIEQQLMMDQLTREQLDANLMDMVSNLTNRAQSIRNEYDRSAARIGGDADLSPGGKQSRLAQAAQTAGENAHQALDPQLEKLATEVVDVERILLERKQPEGGATARSVVNTYIWQRIDAMDELEVQVLCREAASRGDLQLIDGILDCPIPLVSDLSTLRQIRGAAAKVASPATDRRLQELRHAESMLRNALDRTLSHCGYRGDNILERLATG